MSWFINKIGVKLLMQCNYELGYKAYLNSEFQYYIVENVSCYWSLFWTKWNVKFNVKQGRFFFSLLKEENNICIFLPVFYTHYYVEASFL